MIRHSTHGDGYALFFVARCKSDFEFARGNLMHASSNAAPAAPRMVLCESTVNFQSSTPQGRNRPTLAVIPAIYAVVKGFAIPAGTLVANYAAITSFRMIFEEGEKRKIRKTFSQYLSPGVIALNVRVAAASDDADLSPPEPPARAAAAMPLELASFHTMNWTKSASLVSSWSPYWA